MAFWTVWYFIPDFKKPTRACLGHCTRCVGIVKLYALPSIHSADCKNTGDVNKYCIHNYDDLV